MDLEAIADLAGRPRSMGTEIRKGRALAQYVTERQNITKPPLDSTIGVKEVSELRSEVNDFKQGTKGILQDIVGLLDRVDVLSEDSPTASTAISVPKTTIREL